jgi:hypothetical protein
VIGIPERPTPADRDETGVADLRKDHSLDVTAAV